MTTWSTCHIQIGHLIQLSDIRIYLKLKLIHLHSLFKNLVILLLELEFHRSHVVVVEPSIHLLHLHLLLSDDIIELCFFLLKDLGLLFLLLHLQLELRHLLTVAESFRFLSLKVIFLRL